MKNPGKLFVITLFVAMIISYGPIQIEPASAYSNGVVISQIYGGGGNANAPYTHDFIELFNRGTSPISLNGWSLQYTSAAGTGDLGASSTQITPLPDILLAPGQYFLVQEAGGAVGAPLPTPDTTDASPINMSQTGGKVALVNSIAGLGCNGGSTPCTPAQLALILDLVGWGAANFYETAPAPATTVLTAAIRNSGGCVETDNNLADFSSAAPTPRNTSSPTNVCPDPAPIVLTLAPSNGATQVPLDSNIIINFSEAVDVTGSWFDLSCATSGSHTAVVSGGPSTFTFDPDSNFTAGESCTLTVYAANVTDQDDEDPPDNMAANYIVSFTAYIDAIPTVVSITPINGATQVPLNSNLEVVFSEPVNVTGTWFSLNCTPSGAHTALVSGGPTTFLLNPDSDYVIGDVCTFTIYAANVNDQDTDDPPGRDYMVSDVTSGFTANDVCSLSFTPIFSIQGSGPNAAVTGNVSTQGVVVGDFETSASASGFYIQDPVGDANAATSDGIFVYTGSNDFAAPGQLVRVTGYSRERFSQTTINGSNDNSAVVSWYNIVLCGSGSINPTVVTMPFAPTTIPEQEQYEGMLVTFPQELVVAEYYNFDRYGEIVLGLPFAGQSRLYTPTSVVEPGAAAIARAAENALRRITLDDANSAENPVILRHPDGSPFSLTNLFRGGDLVQNVVGVLGYNFSLYRIFPTAAADVTLVNTRPQAPEVVGGRIKISAMNTLNYFVTLDYPAGDPLDNKCGPQLTLECRGADSDQPLEFTRQRTKLLAALSGLDAAVIGLNEIENTTGVEPLADIVAGLNNILGAGSYAYINTGAIGTDAIKVGLIYKPGEVTPVGVFKLLTTSVDPRFLDNLNRPALAQTFEENSTGARFTVVVNHLKSKSSPCDAVGDPDTGDGQGNCNQTRLTAAQALVDWLATDPTGSGDPDFIIMGDLNSYAMEDPIDAIKLGPDDVAGTADDYTNLIFDYHGLYAYSYVFDGQNGYLDHALANASMAGQVTGVTDWHINADESDVLDYDTTFKPPEQENIYEPNVYRTSDHDPVIAGLDLDFADLELAMNESSDPVLPGQVYTYTITVTNNGTIPAPGVWVSDTLPAGSGFVSMTSSQGTCDQALRTCNLGDIAAGGQATVKVTLRAPMTPGLVSNLARTGASIYELQANNSVSITTFVKYMILMPMVFTP